MQIREEYNNDYTNTTHYLFCYATTSNFPQAEVQDTNDYYDCLYDERTTGTRDNNSTYGDT